MRQILASLQDKQVRAYHISQLAHTESGQALMAWLQEEIDLLEGSEELGKICDDPFSQDFRFKLGLKSAYKRVIRKPQECLETLKHQEGG